MEWEAWEAIIIANVRFPYILYDFFNGVGSVGSPESLKMYRLPYIFHDFFGGVGSVTPRNFENTKISVHFS